MKTRKITISLLIITLLSFILVGCSIPDLSKSNLDVQTDQYDISYNAYAKVNSQEEISAELLKTMKNNKEKSYFFVSDVNLINADYWLTTLDGIEEIKCEYRILKDGYNVVVHLKYWDNYSIVHAYKNNNTSLLTEKQLQLYNKYCEILDTYTSKENSDWINELAIHDYLVNNTTYTLGDGAIYNAYDTLINGTAVCNGYTECFKTFMDMLGIECIAISGTAGDELHIWNLVKLENEWYQVDVTWDDPINGNGSVEHAYFNITDEDMLKDHIWDATLYPASIGTKYNYPTVKNLPTFSQQSELVSFLNSQLKSNSTNIEFATTNAIDLKSSIEKCGINVSYSYNISNTSKFSVYKLEFTYE